MLPPAPPQSSYVSDKDQLYLEDDAGRISLTEKEPHFVNSLVTGIVAAVKGIPNNLGEFEIQEVCFPDLAPQHSLSGISKK